MKFSCTTAVIVGAALVVSGNAFGQGSDAILDLLMKKGVITQREANEVREQLDQQNAQTVEMFNKVKVASWIDQVKWYGDFRLRLDYISQEESLNKPDRLRWRFRLRPGV